jgi:large subunit ribosomal protein L3
MNDSMGLVGRKLGMTQIFEDDGNVVPCTVIEAGPCTVLRVKKTDDKDGYNAIQFGFGAQKASRLTKADLGQLAKVGLAENPPRLIREIRVNATDAGAVEAGKVLGPADVFKVGERVDVVGQSKGRGFSGVMRRHNFKGFISTHGNHEYFRHGGSVGTRLTPGMTLSGKKMPGQMGAHQVTVQNLEVAKIDTERNLIYVCGGVPGPVGAMVAIRRTTRHAK